MSAFSGGLNTRDGADVVADNQAIDLLNVTFTPRGGVAQRPGYAKLTTSALTNRADSFGLYYTTTGIKHLLVGAGTRLEALSTAGVVVASATGLSQGPWTFARVGTPNNERAYAGNGPDTLRRWDGAAWSAPTATVDTVAGLAMPKGGCVAVEAKDNRLVVGGFETTTGGPNGAASSPSHVYFSEPGNPEGWMVTANPTAQPPTYANYVQLTPGDGERVMAIVSWRDQVFVFKETKFFVFYGTSVSGDGTPTFNYRPVEGVDAASRRAVCVGRDGVYFLSKRGIFRTQGGEPQLISGILDPFFLGGTTTLFKSSPLNWGSVTQSVMAWHEERVYCAVPTGASTTNNRLLVFDTQSGWWTLYDIQASALIPFKVSNADELIFGYATGSNDIGRHSGAYGNDDGNAIVSRWRSGFFDYGSPDEKTIRETKLWGSGRVHFGLSSDFRETTQSADMQFDESQDTWGGGTGPDLWGGGSSSDLWGPTGGALNPKMARLAMRGTVFSVEFSNTVKDQSWQVHRLVNHLRETRTPNVVQA